MFGALALLLHHSASLCYGIVLIARQEEIAQQGLEEFVGDLAVQVHGMGHLPVTVGWSHTRFAPANEGRARHDGTAGTDLAKPIE